MLFSSGDFSFLLTLSSLEAWWQRPLLSCHSESFVTLSIPPMQQKSEHGSLTVETEVSVFSFLMVALKIEAGRSCKGVSLRMMECS